MIKIDVVIRKLHKFSVHIRAPDFQPNSFSWSFIFKEEYHPAHSALLFLPRAAFTLPYERGTKTETDMQLDRHRKRQ